MNNSFDKIQSILKVASDIIGNQTVYTPVIRRSILSLINILITLTSFSLILYSSNFLYGWGLLAIEIMIMIPFSIYYHMRQRFIQSLLIHSHLVDTTPLTFSEAEKQISSQRFGVLTVALMEHFINRELRARQDAIDNDERESRTGFFAWISRMFLSSIESVLDVAENYLIASMAIDQKGIVSSVKKLQQLKDNMGASVAGGVAFNLASKSSSNILKMFEALSWILGIWLGFILGRYVPDNFRTAMAEGWMTAYPSYSHLCFIPLMVLAGASVYVSYVYYFLFETIENIYYTSMYDLANNKDKIKSELVTKLKNVIEDSAPKK